MTYREKCLREKGEQCVECDATEQIEVHHIDGDRTNNRLSNLVPLCHDCHMKVHNGELPEWSEKIQHHPPGGPVSEEDVDEALNDVEFPL